MVEGGRSQELGHQDLGGKIPCIHQTKRTSNTYYQACITQRNTKLHKIKCLSDPMQPVPRCFYKQLLSISYFKGKQGPKTKFYQRAQQAITKQFCILKVFCSLIRYFFPTLLLKLAFYIRQVFSTLKNATADHDLFLRG